MIVSCEQCRTQFRLDEAKVPETGARVRCSKCNHAFFIAPPGQADAVEAERLAQEAVASARGSGADEGESDWEFNHDAEPRSDASAASPSDLAAAREAVDDLLGALAGTEPSTSDAAPLAEEEDATPEIGDAPDAPFGSAEPEAAEAAASDGLGSSPHSPPGTVQAARQRSAFLAASMVLVYRRRTGLPPGGTQR